MCFTEWKGSWNNFRSYLLDGFVCQFFLFRSASQCFNLIPTPWQADIRWYRSDTTPNPHCTTTQVSTWTVQLVPAVQQVEVWCHPESLASHSEGASGPELWTGLCLTLACLSSSEVLSDPSSTQVRRGASMTFPCSLVLNIQCFSWRHAAGRLLSHHKDLLCFTLSWSIYVSVPAPVSCNFPELLLWSWNRHVSFYI